MLGRGRFSAGATFQTFLILLVLIIPYNSPEQRLFFRTQWLRHDSFFLFCQTIWREEQGKGSCCGEKLCGGLRCGRLERVAGMMGAGQVNAIQLPARLVVSGRRGLRSVVNSRVSCVNCSSILKRASFLLEFAEWTPILAKFNAMDNYQLTCRRHDYLEGAKKTKLNTVDVWIPDCAPIAKEDGKIWVMFVRFPLP